MKKTNEDELLFDILALENEVVKAYSFAMLSCTTSNVHENMLDILCDQHQICLDIKDELSKRGFVKPIQSNRDELDAVINRFKQ